MAGNVRCVCLACGKGFNTYPSRKGLYCSRVCANAGLSVTRAGDKSEKWAGGPAVRFCEVCGSQFHIGKAKLGIGWGRFCSPGCKAQGQRKEKVKLSCDGCGVEFERYPSEVAKHEARGSSGIYCSKKCRGAVLGESQKGEANPHWRGGTTTENTRIRQSIEGLWWREAVLKRDDYTCRHCGAKGSRRRGAAVVLHAHHIRGFAAFPDLRFDVDNGLTLCMPCHHKVHAA